MDQDKYDHISDAELLDRFFDSRDNKWLGILLPRYTLLLLGVCMKYMKNEEDAKDCVQQIFLKVIRELPKYKVEYFKSWIYTVARNHCLMTLRNRKKVKVEWNEQVIYKEDVHEIATKHLEKEKLLNQMEASIQKLKPEQQECINLFYLQKKSYAEISEITGFSTMQVKSFLQNGKRKLQMLMQEK